jgi:hypothetical protein
VRGGALPVLAWSAILVLLYAGNWVWSGKSVEVFETCFALAAIVLFALLLAALNRAAVHRGPPEPTPGVEPIPEFSFGAIGAALAIGCAALGAAFGHFLIYFGAGLFVVSLARLAQELRSSRLTARRYRLHPIEQARSGAGSADRATREGGR